MVGSEAEEHFSSVDAELPMGLIAAFTLILNADTLAVLSSDLDWFENDFNARMDINPHVEDEPPDSQP